MVAHAELRRWVHLALAKALTIEIGDRPLRTGRSELVSLLSLSICVRDLSVSCDSSWTVIIYIYDNECQIDLARLNISDPSAGQLNNSRALGLSSSNPASHNFPPHGKSCYSFTISESARVSVTPRASSKSRNVSNQYGLKS